MFLGHECILAHYEAVTVINVFNTTLIVLFVYSDGRRQQYHRYFSVRNNWRVYDRRDVCLTDPGW